MDVLQTPLDTIVVDLPMNIYRSFELDVAKYNLYTAAIEKALKDLSTREELCVAILGAGRGPLVDCLFKAEQSAGIAISRIVVVEKNPSAFIMY